MSICQDLHLPKFEYVPTARDLQQASKNKEFHYAKNGCSYHWGEMIYEECSDNRGEHCTRSIFFYFPAGGSTNPDVF